MNREAILIGNPNTGKTTLYNSLTGAFEHVGNFHGVTVEEKESVYEFNGDTVSLVDLPGLYSLSTLSYEEEVARDYFFKHKDAKIVNICDANNLARNLYLTLSLLESGCDIVLCINLISKKPAKIDAMKLEKMLKIPVVLVDAQKGEGVFELNEQIFNYSSSAKPSYVKKFDTKEVKQILSPYFDPKELDFFAIKALEHDEYVLNKLNEKERELLEKAIKKDSNLLVAKERYAFIDKVIKECVVKEDKIYGKSKLDKVFLNKFLALPIFLVILSIIFYLTFFSLGAFISDILEFLLDKIVAAPLLKLCSNMFSSLPWVTSLIENAIIGGAMTILSFLPQVALLFMFLSILEDTGYMSRVAFMFEDILCKVGLSGKSVYTLLMGFGCSSSAILTARNMEDKNAKIKTALITPYMSCSAKFPIYVVIGGAFFGVNNIFYILGLYILGVIIAVLLSYIFEKTILKSKAQSFILELPPYQVPSLKKTLKVLKENIILFISRVGSLIISMNVIIWALSNFGFNLKYTPSTKGSMLEGIGKFLAPIFIPLGFGTWGAASSLVTGFIAKEVILSSIVLFNGGGKLTETLKNPLSAVFFASNASVISFLVFSLLYCPCVTSIAVLRKEIGKKWTIFGAVLQFVVAYIISLVVYLSFSLMEVFGVMKVLGVILGVVAVVVAVMLLVFKIKRKKLCSHCKSCKKCKKNI